MARGESSAWRNRREHKTHRERQPGRRPRCVTLRGRRSYHRAGAARGQGPGHRTAGHGNPELADDSSTGRYHSSGRCSAQPRRATRRTEPLFRNYSIDCNDLSSARCSQYLDDCRGAEDEAVESLWPGHRRQHLGHPFARLPDRPADRHLGVDRVEPARRAKCFRTEPARGTAQTAETLDCNRCDRVGCRQHLVDPLCKRHAEFQSQRPSEAEHRGTPSTAA